MNQSIKFFSTIFLFAVLLIIFLSFIFPDFDWARTGLFVGRFFHYLDVPATMLLFAVILLLFYILLMRFFSRMNQTQLRVVTAILWTTVLLFEVLIIFSFHGILPPEFDGGHTYIQAINLLDHKNMSESLPYFQIYPNNIAITVIRYWVYRLLCFGHPTNFILADQITCAIGLNIGIYFTWKFIALAFNLKMANLLLILILTCFPLFLYIIYFYTDSVALMFPSMLLYLTYKFSKTDQFRYIVIIAILLAVSVQIRENMILILPALIIYILLIKNIKKTIICTAIIAVFIAGFGFAAQSYEKHLGFTKNPALQMPATSWLLMGLSYSGRYNMPDYKLTLSQPTQHQKQSADIEAIKNRIKNKEWSGLSLTWAIKAARTFGDGSQAYYWYSSNNTDYSTSYNYLFGNRKQLIVFLVQIIHIADLMLLALSAIGLLHRRKIDGNLFIQLCLFGSILFYVFVWEAEPRYSLLFTLLELSGAVYGLEELRFLSTVFVRKAKQKQVYLAAAVLTLTGLFVLTAAVAAKNYETYTLVKSPQKIYSVNQPNSKGLMDAPVNATHQVEQTFRAAGSFTHVRFEIKGKRGKALYRLSIIAKGQNHQVLGQKTVTSAKMKSRGYETIVINHEPDHRGLQDYILTIKQISVSPRSELLLGMNGKGMYEQRDMYLGGALYINHVMQNAKDLQFQVYTIKESPYLNDAIYGILFLIPIIILTIGFFGLLRMAWLPSGKRKLSVNQI